MRVVVLGTRGFPGIQGGVEKHCENLYWRIARSGCEVIVFARRPYLERRLSHWRGVKLVSLPCPKNKFLEAFSHTLIGIFTAIKFRPHLIHIHAIGPSLFVPIARMLGIKVVVTNHGPDYQRKKWNRFAKFVLRLSERLGSRWANSVICISRPIAQNLKINYDINAHVVPNGVPAPKLINTCGTLEKYGLQKGRYILSVGRFVPEKGFDDLIEAYKSRANGQYGDGPEWKLVIVGDADHEDQYSIGLKLKAKEDLGVVMTGFLAGDSLAELYSHAGLFVLPSYYEGLPIVLLEAMSYGLCCVASDIEANRQVDLLQERYFKPGNVPELSSRIDRFIREPLSPEEKKAQMDQIRANYNWDNISGQVLDVYRRAIA